MNEPVPYIVHESIIARMESAPDERTKAEYRKFIAKMESM